MYVHLRASRVITDITAYFGYENQNPSLLICLLQVLCLQRLGPRK
jgi:hypothetical protein